MHELIIPFNCSICSRLCFFIKNFEHHILSISDDLSGTGTEHECQFMWQDLKYRFPVNRLNKITSSNWSDLEGHNWQPAARNPINSQRLIVWKQDRSAGMCQLVADNGQILEMEVESDIELKIGQLLMLRGSARARLKKVTNFDYVCLIADSQIRWQKVAVLRLNLVAKDSWQLEQQIARITSELNKISQKPIMIEAKKRLPVNDWHQRLLIIVDHQFSEVWLQQLIFPEWLIIKWTRGFMELPATDNF